MKCQQSFKGYFKTQVIPKIFKIKSVKSLLKTKLIGISKKSDSILRHLPGPPFLHPPQYETVARWVNVKWNKGTWSLFSIKKQTVGYLLKKKAHLWLLTVQWPLDRQKVPSACTEESIQSLNWLSTGNRRIVECVLERTPATLSSFAWAAQSAGPGRLCDILKDTHRLVCSSLFLFKSNYDEIASPRVTCYLYRVCVPWRIRPSAGVQVHVGHREILWHQV